MNIVLPKVVSSLLIVAGICVFYVSYATQQNEFYKNIGIVLAIFLFIFGGALYYWEKRKYYNELRFRVRATPPRSKIISKLY